MPDAPTLLLIENDEDDFRCLSAALRSVAPSPRVAWARDVSDAAAYLEGQDGYAERKFFPWPDLVLLDLKAPTETPLGFVRWLRGRRECRALPVLALSACAGDFEVVRAAEAGVTAFFPRPCEAARLTELLGGFVAHWRSGAASRFAPWPGAVALSTQSCAA
jgi:CheY-like chemotaxis protein